MSRSEQLFGPGILLVVVTYRCPAQCRHCMWDCGPTRSEEIDWDVLGRFVVESGTCGLFDKISITGGEPITVLGEVERFSRTVTDSVEGIGLVTCCSWAHSVDKAIGVLGSIDDLSVVTVSRDKYHAEFISGDYVCNVLQACTYLGIDDVIINVVSSQHGDVDEVKAELGQAAANSSFMVQPLTKGGRAIDWIENGSAVYGEPRGLCPARGPCVRVDGRIVACCGPLVVHESDHLVVGDMKVDHPRDVHSRFYNDPLVRALRVLGPERIASIVFEHEGIDVLSGRRFIRDSCCSVCYDLMISGAMDFARDILSRDDMKRYVAMVEFFRGAGEHALLEHKEEPCSEQLD